MKNTLQNPKIVKNSTTIGARQSILENFKKMANNIHGLLLLFEFIFFQKSYFPNSLNTGPRALRTLFWYPQIWTRIPNFGPQIFVKFPNFENLNIGIQVGGFVKKVENSKQVYARMLILCTLASKNTIAAGLSNLYFRRYPRIIINFPRNIWRKPSNQWLLRLAFLVFSRSPEL